MKSSLAVSGPIFNIANGVLKSYPEYLAYCAGRLNRSSYEALLDRLAPYLIAAGLPPEDVHFAKRYPPSEESFVRQCLMNLCKHGILPEASYNVAQYQRIAADMRLRYHHGPFKTYIYPEEARLLFAIVDIVKPRSIIFLGSYYGYWAHAAIISSAGYGGRVVLVDPDPHAQAIADINVVRVGLKNTVEIAITTGETYLRANTSQFDFVVLDAENPRAHPDPEQAGKCVYGSLLRHVLPYMTPGGYLVCHNILFTNVCGDEFFSRIIARNQRELSPFMDLVRQEIPNFVEVTSTEGVGVGTKRGGL
jgi:predicted O-methyltransferase YrrM